MHACAGHAESARAWNSTLKLKLPSALVSRNGDAEMMVLPGVLPPGDGEAALLLFLLGVFFVLILLDHKEDKFKNGCSQEK